MGLRGGCPQPGPVVVERQALIAVRAGRPVLTDAAQLAHAERVRSFHTFGRVTVALAPRIIIIIIIIYY